MKRPEPSDWKSFAQRARVKYVKALRIDADMAYNLRKAGIYGFVLAAGEGEHAARQLAGIGSEAEVVIHAWMDLHLKNDF